MGLIKISKTFDEWAFVADALDNHGRAEKSARSLLAAADIMEAIGLTTTAAATREQAYRLLEAGT